MNLCQYSDIFGKPREGAHSYRIGDFAIVDIILTIIAGIIAAKLFKQDILPTVGVLFIIAIVAHWGFCVDTKLNTILFPK